MQITWIGSPNFDSNRTNIDRVVIHWFGVGKQTGADATFQKSGGTSAHYSIEDNSVHQYVKESDVAYHAGVYSMNQRSIGIEHSAEPGRNATEETYQSSGKLVREICLRYNIPIDREHIIKHSEVPRATSCPGTIDIDKVVLLARGNSMDPKLQALLTKYNVQSIDDLDSKIMENCGLNWGSEAIGGGFLGDARREVTSLKAQLANQPIIDMSKWQENGMTITTTSGNTVTATNYKVR